VTTADDVLQRLFDGHRRGYLQSSFVARMPANEREAIRVSRISSLAQVALSQLHPNEYQALYERAAMLVDGAERSS
jgi:hypothetical protein